MKTKQPRAGPPATADWGELLREIRARTPARLLVGHAGAGYRTATQLELREAHAAARDAVSAELELERDFDREFAKHWNLFAVATQAQTKQDYLLRPDLGRHFDAAARQEVARRCPRGSQLQIAIGDGLSVTAVITQVPQLLAALDQGAQARGWKVGQVFVIRRCRVGILNEIGEILGPEVAVLLIGERPGLATAESLSAYMAFRPRTGHSDANRNLVSNIHQRGVRPEQAAIRILKLAEQMMRLGISGCEIREQLRGTSKPAVSDSAGSGK